METIDITPTPEGLRASIKLFEESIATAQKTIDVAEHYLETGDLPPDEDYMGAAFEALVTVENERIARLREGIESARKGLGE